MADKEESGDPPPAEGDVAATEESAPFDLFASLLGPLPSPTEPPDGGETAAPDDAEASSEAAPKEEGEPGEGAGEEEEEEEQFHSATEALEDEGGDAKEGDKKEKDEDEEDTPEKIAEDILEMIIQSTEQLAGSVSLDSLVLNELKETEEEAQKLAQSLAERKEEIMKLKEKSPLTVEDVDEIKAKQQEIKDMVAEFEELTAKMKELLEKSLRPGAPLKADILPGVCAVCGQTTCICTQPVEENLPPPICVCEEPGVCICDKAKPYAPGAFYDQQVADLFPQPKEVPICICGSQSYVCVCPFDDKDKECICKKEDLKQFNIIADVMPKVVVCAPDVSLPRIIVCEPYTPLKQKPRKPHVCERNRACKLYKY